MLGDQIYIAALVELAAKTPVGKTWMLDRSRVLLDLSLTVSKFNELQRVIEARMPGKWDKASATDGNLYVYMRTD